MVLSPCCCFGVCILHSCKGTGAQESAASVAVPHLCPAHVQGQSGNSGRASSERRVMVVKCKLGRRGLFLEEEKVC